MPISAQPAIGPNQLLRQYFDSLLREFGPQHWWPARTRLEVILGAILTQNTSWQNAALGIRGLRKAGLLSMSRLKQARRAEIEAAIRPSGFFRQKTRTIRNFVAWLVDTCRGSLSCMLRRPTVQLRAEMLEIQGLGPETVDAILLYACGIPRFVADAYTRRILSRHGLIPDGFGYHETQEFLHSHLPEDAQLFNEFHALLVEAGKRHCRRSAPECHNCPLERFLAKDDRQTAGSDLGSIRKANGFKIFLSAQLPARAGRIGPESA
ncbi:MAG: endonuclease III domain-containing protein [Deltaproteobacteria bacterium]